MDLNQLYFDHQISLMRAKATSSARLRLIHGRNAAIIARSIECIHRASGAAVLRNWSARGSSDDPEAAQLTVAV